MTEVVTKLKLKYQCIVAAEIIFDMLYPEIYKITQNKTRKKAKIYLLKDYLGNLLQNESFMITLKAHHHPSHAAEVIRKLNDVKIGMKRMKGFDDVKIFLTDVFQISNTDEVSVYPPNIPKIDLAEETIVKRYNEVHDERRKKALDNITSNGSANDIIASVYWKRGRVYVTRESMNTLKSGQWLNDEIICFYYHLLQLSCQEVPPSSYFVPSTFSGMMVERAKKTNISEDDLSDDFVKDHIKNYFGDGKCESSVKKVYIPRCSNLHWILVYVDVQNGTINIYDSLEPTKLSHIKDARKRIQMRLEQTNAESEYGDLYVKYMRMAFPKVTWRLCSVDNELGTQKNGVDCGVYILMYTVLLHLGHSHLEINDELANVERYKIAYSIMNKKLDLSTYV